MSKSKKSKKLKKVRKLVGRSRPLPPGDYHVIGAAANELLNRHVDSLLVGERIVPPNPPEWRNEFSDFLERLTNKVELGAHKYGGKSFDLPVSQTFDEIELELLDICGWSFIFWTRLQHIRKSLGLPTTREVVS